MFLGLVVLVGVVGLLPAPAAAQTGEPTATPEPAGPQTYTVQSGDTLFGIAAAFGVDVNDLQRLNGLTDPESLAVGQVLLIPGPGVVASDLYVAQPGDSLAQLARGAGVTAAELAAANRLLSPQLAAGQPLLLPVPPLTDTLAVADIYSGTLHVAAAGDTWSGLAAANNIPLADLLAANGRAIDQPLFAGEQVRLPGPGAFQALDGYWSALRIEPLPLVPGQTAVVYVESQLEGLPTGQLGDQTLRFAPYGDGFVALVGLEPVAPAGRYGLALGGSGDRPWRPLLQDVIVAPGDYGTQAITLPDGYEALLDPTIRADEDAFLATIFGEFTPERQWDGPFQAPVSSGGLVTSDFGTLRSYNGGPYEIYHTGVDFALPAGTPVFAPAGGTVVFADLLELRGNVLILDHGWGVMSAYYHLSSISVAVGDMVVTGQTIGAIGTTGLSSGPHLHWDVRILNVPVDGRQWLNQTFP